MMAASALTMRGDGVAMKKWRLVLGAVAGMVLAAAGPPAAFAKAYKCVDPVNKAVTLSDLPCRESLAPTPAQAAASAEAERQAQIEEEARQSARRADRQLRDKYPDEAAHRRAHVAALLEVSRMMRVPTARYWDLVTQRKPLDAEAAFYVGKPLPPDLKRKIDANEAAFAALVDVFRGLQLEVVTIDLQFANERVRLSRLWAGAPLGSMGPLPAVPSPTLPPLPR
jgi:hypothetical protein